MESNVCMKCSSAENVNVVDVLPLRYGSRFDEWGTRIYLCSKCLKSSPFSSMKVVIDKELAMCSNALNEQLLVYENEDAMFDYVESLSLDSQEKFFNSFAYGEFYTKMDRETWIKNEKMRMERESSEDK